MRLFRQIALSALLTIGTFSAVTYTSCTKDACASVTCDNGGSCSGGTCVCVTGFEGTNCQTLSRTKFLGTWTANEVVGSTPLVYSLTMGSGSTSDVTSIIISNAFSDNFFTIGPIMAYVSGNTLTIPSQAPDANKYNLQGSGTYSGGVITVHYTITNTSTSVTQNYSGTWQ